jgi:hypothetical protein
MLTRRILLGVAAGALVTPGPANAMFLSKLPWKEIVAVGANVAALVEFFRNTLMGGGGGANAAPAPLPICAAKRSDIATINRLCFQLALATNTKDFQASVEIGDNGLLPALAAYSTNPNPSSWRSFL